MDYKKLYFDLLERIKKERDRCEEFFKLDRQNLRNQGRLFFLNEITDLHNKLLIDELLKENK